jgi:hypothetical protein
MAETKLSPGPWVAVEYGRELGGTGPSFIRIEDANGGKVADLYIHSSVGGCGVDPCRANAAWIVEHGPKGQS